MSSRSSRWSAATSNQWLTRSYEEISAGIGGKRYQPWVDFAVIPRYVEHLLTGSEGPVPAGLPDRADHVVVVLLDAFGAAFLERFRDHPLLRDAVVSPLYSQFPSTTAAHVTTMHSG